MKGPEVSEILALGFVAFTYYEWASLSAASTEVKIAGLDYEFWYLGLGVTVAW